MTKKEQRKWEIGAGVITLILVISFTILVMLSNKGYAMDEVERNPGNDKCDSAELAWFMRGGGTMPTWMEKEWNEFLEYQKKGWAEGKEQLALNKQQLVNLPNTVVTEGKDLFSNIGTALNKVLGN